SIVRDAGVTTGSFYWYYKSKEELFEALVGKHYDHILQMYDDALESFWKMTKEEQKEHMGDIGGKCMAEMVEYMYRHLTEFKLLLTAASGTRYENLLHELTQREIDSTHEFEMHMAELGYPMGTQIEPVLEHSITSGMFAGMFELVIHDVPKEKAVNCVRQIHAFYTAGWQKLMGI
ncbi:MAG: TetR/AcrR family transcriptional regulator, partial [Lachnospiraceae bacterium]|nr:TetR/AcrR family transcriptional regulator [Lachnospiraceae bacterium]